MKWFLMVLVALVVIVSGFIYGGLVPDNGKIGVFVNLGGKGIAIAVLVCVLFGLIWGYLWTL